MEEVLQKSQILLAPYASSTNFGLVLRPYPISTLLELVLRLNTNLEISYFQRAEFFCFLYMNSTPNDTSKNDVRLYPNRTFFDPKITLLLKPILAVNQFSYPRFARHGYSYLVERLSNPNSKTNVCPH